MINTLYKAYISRSALEHNINCITKENDAYFAVIKADAYGHGLLEVADACLSFESAKKLKYFVVGSIEEGVLLRKQGIKTPLLALLGIRFSENKNNANLAKEHSITVLVHNKETLKEAVENNITFALKWNTGMNRFGFSEEELSSVLDYIQNKDVRLDVNMSHFSMVEDFTENGLDFTLAQLEAFNRIHEKVREKFPSLPSSIGQSAYILRVLEILQKENTGAKKEQMVQKNHIPRIGGSLYGINPLWGTEFAAIGENLKAVMQITAPILSLRELKAGESIGYGQMPVHKKSLIGLVGIGYSDGYRRQYIQKQETTEARVNFYAEYKGMRVPCVGNVCMQVSFFDFTGCNVKVGETVSLLGGTHENSIKLNELAYWWDTLPAELLCVFGKTSERFFVK